MVGLLQALYLYSTPSMWHSGGTCHMKGINEKLFCTTILTVQHNACFVRYAMTAFRLKLFRNKKLEFLFLKTRLRMSWCALFSTLLNTKSQNCGPGF